MLDNKINAYYRAVLSSIDVRNSKETNLVLLREVMEVLPLLSKSACDIVYSGRIAKCVYAPNDVVTSQCFYTIPSANGTLQYLVMHGYCTCFHFAENVLARESAFTCKHELACLILEHLGPDLGSNHASLFHSVEELDEPEYLERLHLLHDI